MSSTVDGIEAGASFIAASVSAAVVVLILTVAGASEAQQRYVRAEETPDHELAITTSTGEGILLAKRRDTRFDEDQQKFDAIALSPDGTAVGWLAYYPNCCTSYPIALALEVYSGGQRRTFAPAIVAGDWCFVDGAAKVAAISTTVHGPQHEIIQLWDVASGNLIEQFTWMEDRRYPRAPTWVRAIRAQRSEAAASKTHICTTK
ncbi:MAG TPA: hypothetical protein VM096_16795 [Vicinamibacterales bacterium]|nr:hypothetical protein [Vicinamibacterales bacterium]